MCHFDIWAFVSKMYMTVPSTSNTWNTSQSFWECLVGYNPQFSLDKILLFSSWLLVEFLLTRYINRNFSKEGSYSKLLFFFKVFAVLGLRCCGGFSLVGLRCSGGFSLVGLRCSGGFSLVGLRCCGVFSLVETEGAPLQLQCSGFLQQWHLLLQTIGSAVHALQ